jgi:hypothetical protein
MCRVVAIGENIETTCQIYVWNDFAKGWSDRVACYSGLIGNEIILNLCGYMLNRILLHSFHLEGADGTFF